jgi:cbb3-type cytochrome oxidase maturation protein
MNIVFFMIPIAILLGAGFLAAFLWANWSGQFEDLNGPAHRLITDDDNKLSGRKYERNPK